MKVLLSIKPEYVEKIFNGSKKFEFRKVLYQNKEVRTIIVYATMPVGKIVGEFDVARVVTGTPSEVWAETADHAGITHSFFAEYFDGRECAYALAIGDVREYEEPIVPDLAYENFSPPQSFMYVERSPLEPMAQPVLI